MLINVDGLRHKAAFVDGAVRRMSAAGLDVGVIVLNETRLVPTIDVELAGFFCAARRDRGRPGGGGGVAIYAARSLVAYATYTAPADGDIEATEVAVLAKDGTVACRVLGVYRPPDAGSDVFAEIAARAEVAAGDGAPFVCLGDLNVPNFDGARQAREWTRAPRTPASSAPEAAALARLLDEARLTVVSGTVASCGPDAQAAASHFRPGAAPSELDFVLADDAALELARGGATENGRGALSPAPWAMSHHRAVWVGLDLDAAVQPPPVPPRFPPARWRSAGPEERHAYAADLAARLAPMAAEIAARGLAWWRGDAGAVVSHAIIPAIHAAQAATVGVTRHGRREAPAEPPWWDADCETTACRRMAAAAAFSSAAAGGDDAEAARASAELRDATRVHGRAEQRARAAFFEWRLVDEASGDRSAMSAVYDELQAHLAKKRPRGGRGTAHVWRALRDADGRLVAGAAVEAELTAQVTAAWAYDAKDPRFCAATAAALTAGTAALRRSAAFAAECADPSFAGGGPVDAAEAAAAKATAKLGRVAHPGDGVVPEALLYGGAGLDSAFALVSSAILETGHVPAPSRTGAMRSVYKKGDVTRLLNHRGVVLSSHIAKWFERILLPRLLAATTGVDELQAVANPGVDVRAQLHLLYDVDLANGGVWIMTIDITRGFPSTSRDLTIAALRRHGAGGRLLRAIMGLIFDTSVVVGMRPGVDTEAVSLGVGLLEGAVLSPALFAYATSGLLDALRESDLGARLGGVWCGALMLMDDLALLARDEAELAQMAAVVFKWAHEARFVLALKDKSHVLRPRSRAPGTGASTSPATTATTLRWQPQPPSQRESHVEATFPHRASLKYLGFLLSARGGPDAHVQRQLGTARAVVARMEAEYAGRAAVTFNQAAWLWTLHGRTHLEWPAAVLPPPLPGSFDATVVFEQEQHRALHALLGPSAVRPAASVLLAVFGLWRLDERRLVARACYAFAWVRTWRRPQRAALGAELCALADADAGFDQASITGAVARALHELGYADWPAVPDDAPRGDPGEAPAADPDDADDADVDGRRPPPSDSSDDDGERGEDTGGGGGDGADDADEAVGVTAAKRAWEADVRRRAARLVAAREAALWAANGPRSAALWREIARPWPSAAERARLRAWMRRCVLSLTADARGAALVAFVAGCWWAAPTSRVASGAGGGFVPAQCAACGATSAALPLHLALGQFGAEAPCPCRNAAAYRAAWVAEVAALYAAHGDGASRAAYAAAPPFSFRRAALMLGHARGVELPWALASRLPPAFTRTWGAWSAITAGADVDDAPR